MSDSSSLDYDIEEHESNGEHSFDKFDRCYDMFEERWTSRYHYLLFSILLSNGSGTYLELLKLQVELSGGVFIALLIIVSFLFTMPIIYIEIFFGKYTKLTNCQMYRMATIFFGFSLAIFLTNALYGIIGIPEETIVLVNAIKTFLNFNSTKSCMDNNKECYNYLVSGSVNETCQTVFMGLECEKKGLIRYSKQYLHWKMYFDSDNKYYPHSQLIAGLALTWGLILYISTKELDTLGMIMNGAFIIELIIMTIVFILALIYLQSTDCFRTLLGVNPKLITDQDILNAVWFIMGQFAFVIPTGYMTIYAYADVSSNFGFECFLIIFFSLLLTIYYFFIYYMAAGVIAYDMAVAVENIIAPEGGLYLIVIPEFFEHLELPNTFLFLYYTSIWLTGTVKTALCLHMLLLNWYDYFPNTKYFSSYIAVIACTILCLLSIPTCSKSTLQVINY